jgi:hypothetical protein
MNFKEWLIEEDIKKEHSYSSTQINLAKDDRAKILAWSRKNIPTSDLVHNSHAEGRELETHVTVLFGLHDDNSKNVAKALANVKPFHIKLGKISKFEAPTHDVIKFEVISADLVKANRILARLPHTSKYKYAPHCTLAYVKKGSCDHLIGKTPFHKIIGVKEIMFSNKRREKTPISLS